MKTTLQHPLLQKISLCLGTACLLSLNTFAKEPPHKNPNEGTLVGAIQTLIKNNQKSNDDRIITGNISIIQGHVAHPYVMLKGSSRIAFADQNGNFQIPVGGSNPVLIIGGSGIMEQELQLDHEDHYAIALAVEVESDNPYNVSIHGMPVDRRSYNGAFSRVTDRDIYVRAAVTLGTALEGAVAGLQVTGRENGLDGSALALTIRGRGSLHANNAPLIVLDGAPYSGPLHAINPNDVGDITVLKDGLGKSVYGARGGNGVIMITTKRGFNR